MCGSDHLALGRSGHATAFCTTLHRRRPCLRPGLVNTSKCLEVGYVVQRCLWTRSLHPTAPVQGSCVVRWGEGDTSRDPPRARSRKETRVPVTNGVVFVVIIGREEINWPTRCPCLSA